MKRRLVLPTLILGVTVLAGCDGEPDPVKGELPASEDFVLIDGKVHTMNDALPIADAVVVRDGTFAFVGTNEDALANAPDLKVINAQGKTVLPGLIDAHTHPGMIGFLGEDDEAPLIPKTSHEDVLAWLDDYATWKSPLIIQAGEWPTTLYGVEGPNKEELDKIVKWRGVMLFDDSGHSQWLNSSALRMLGVDKDTPDPAPGLSYFVRDENGEPTGWVKEFALIPYVGEDILPPRADIKRRMSEFLDFLSSKGVTTLFDAGNLLYHDHIYDIVAELDYEGRLPMRYYGSIHIVLPSQMPTAVEELKQLREKYESDLLKFETIKIHFDGVQEIRTAAMLEDYLGEDAGRGRTLFTEDELTEFILELHEEDIDLHLHTVGDAAIRTALNAVERARKGVDGELACIVSLSHIEVLSEEDAARFAALGVIANFTPHWSGGYFQGSHETVGAPRSDNLYRVSPISKTGGTVSYSSDTTTYSEMKRANPFYGMQIGHNRQEVAQGPEADVLSPATERLSIDDLVKGYTLGGAIQLGVQASRGSIDVGKEADLVVLETDLFSTNRYQIKDVEAKLVVLGGRILHGDL